MLSESRIVLDLIGGADPDRTRQLLNAISANGLDINGQQPDRSMDGSDPSKDRFKNDSSR
jgi:hypothetical protein